MGDCIITDKSKQILKSGTSIGTNVREDFNAMSQKEVKGTEYRIGLIFETDYMSDEQFNSVHEDCSEIIAMLTSSIKP